MDDVYSLLQTGLMPPKSPRPQVLEQTGVHHQTMEPSPVDSGLGYPVDVSPFSQGDESSSTYTGSNYFIIGIAS